MELQMGMEVVRLDPAAILSPMIIFGAGIFMSQTCCWAGSTEELHLSLREMSHYGVGCCARGGCTRERAGAEGGPGHW